MTNPDTPHPHVPRLRVDLDAVNAGDDQQELHSQLPKWFGAPVG